MRLLRPLVLRLTLALLGPGVCPGMPIRGNTPGPGVVQGSGSSSRSSSSATTRQFSQTLCCIRSAGRLSVRNGALSVTA